MTINDFIQFMDGTPVVPIFVVGLPVLSFAAGRCHERKLQGPSPWCVVYSVAIYLSCAAGISAAVVTAYSLIFLKTNFLDMDLVMHVAPIASMIVTLVVINKQVDLNDVPGFDRLVGLVVLMTGTIVLALIIAKTRIWLMFGGSFMMFVALMIGLFFLLRIGAGMMLGGKPNKKDSEPNQK